MTSPTRGRFDRSFAIRMIRDFMLALMAIVALELGGRYALARYEFATQDRERAHLAAERLAGDVKDIMLNRGGPVAARTVYPVIRRHSEQAHLEIAIVPSPATVRAIERQFGFTPAGIPADWPGGPHHEARVDIVAEPFCLGCHVTSKPGDVLGQVAVRSYRAHRMAEWWSEARVISIVGTGNVLLHTIVLFLLLRVRMEPLLRLRSVAADLARGRLNIGTRVDVRSDDEFGDLAHDFNEFLARICEVFEEMEDVLRRVGAVNERLIQVGGQMDRRVESVQGLGRDAMRRAFEVRERIAGPWAEVAHVLELLLERDGESVPAAGRERLEEPGLRDLVESLRLASGRQRSAADDLEKLVESLSRLSGQLDEDSHYLGEIRLLEERMKAVAGTGRSLLARVRGPVAGARPGEDA